MLFLALLLRTGNFWRDSVFQLMVGACVTHSNICGARLMVGTQMCSTYHFNLLGCIIRCRVGPKILPCAQEHSSYQFGTELSFAKTRMCVLILVTLVCLFAKNILRTWMRDSGVTLTEWLELTVSLVFISGAIFCQMYCEESR